MMYLLGCIKWFDVYKGFGTVISTKGEEFFLHSSNLNYNGFVPEVGTPIIFDGKCVKDKKKAFNARIPKSLDDFTFLIEHISEGTQVKFEEKSTHRGRKGKLITNHYNRVFDIVESGTLNVMKGLKKEEVVKIFQNHFIDYVYNTKDRDVMVNYYRLSKSTIKNLRFYFFQDHCKGTTIDTKDKIVSEVRLGEEIENEIIYFYNKHLSKEYKFWLWKNGLYENKPSYKRIEDIFNDNFVSGPLPIDEDALIDNVRELNQNDFARLIQYEGIDAIVLKLLDLKIQDSQGEIDKIKESIEIILLCKNLEIHELEVKLLASLTDDMVFVFWSTKLYYIDFVNNQLFRYSYGKDYTIPQEILLKNYTYLDEQQIKRIGILPDSSEVIAKIIKLKLNFDREEFILNINTLPILKFAEYITNPETKKNLINTIFNKGKAIELLSMFSHLLRWKGDSKYSIEYQSIPLELSFKIQKDIIYEIIKGQKYYSSRNEILKTLNQEDLIVEALNERVSDLNDKFEYYIYQSFANYLPLIKDELKQSAIIKRLNKVGEEFLKGSIIEEIGEKIKLENEEDFDAIKEIIKDLPEFVNKDTIKEIREEIDKRLLEASTEKNFIQACVSGIIFGIEESFSRFGFRLTHEQIESLFDNNSEFSEEVKVKILKSYININSEYRWILEKANEIENLELFAEIDRAIFNKIDESEYFLYWKDNLGRIFPENYLATYFDDNETKYLNIKEFNNKTELIKLLFSLLSRITIVEDRKSFCTVRNLILSLHNLDNTIIQKILELNKPLYQLILWELGVVESFDFKLLKRKFIYFQPKEQVKIVKKLFYLKQKGTFDLSLDTLQEFVLADIDIFKLNKKINPEIILDLSTNVIFESLKKLHNSGRFLVESELLTLVLSGIGENKTNRVHISDYFSKCHGRTEYKFNWNTNGTIKKRAISEDRFKYIIKFEYDASLVEAIKSIPGRKYDSQKQDWEVPMEYKEEVFNFAKKYKFLYDSEGNKYANNLHLAKLVVSSWPNGISLCEGQEAQDLHKYYNCKFWWCTSSPCFKSHKIEQTADKWEDLTLLDFCNILNLSTEEKSSYGVFSIGEYNQFVSLINRFNSLLDKMYCDECGHILYPKESSNYAAHSVVRFNCINDKCSKMGDIIYLNHCLNGKCNSIIDSRESKTCPNNLYICKDCGSCCSHDMLNRRLSNLQSTGGYIPKELIERVNSSSGHLEKAEYYCYKCGKMMNETSENTFDCYDCSIQYDTSKYGFKYINKHLRRKDYPKYIN